MPDHSPLPWSVIPKKTDDFSDYLVVDANGDGVAAWPTKDGLERIVRCVNLHEDLLAVCRCYITLYDCHKKHAFDTTGLDFCDEPEAVKLGRALLAKAKGG